MLNPLFFFENTASVVTYLDFSAMLAEEEAETVAIIIRNNFSDVTTSQSLYFTDLSEKPIILLCSENQQKQNYLLFSTTNEKNNYRRLPIYYTTPSLVLYILLSLFLTLSVTVIVSVSLSLSISVFVTVSV